MASVDVTVRGAGVMGLSVAWACLALGARVRVIDPQGPAAGASGGVVGALAPHVPDGWNAKKDFQLRALLKAGPFWAEIAAAGGGDPGYGRHGRLQALPDDRAVALARDRGRAAQDHWGAAATWDVIPAPDGWGPVSGSGWVVHDSLTARLHPRRATLALAAAVRAKGGELVPDGPDTELVVEATGQAGLRTLMGGGDAAPCGEKGQAAVLALDMRGAPQIFADGVHVVPQADGTVSVGSTTERVWSHDGTDAGLDDLIARARVLVPALGDAPVTQRWAGIRPRWTTRAPLIGPHPTTPGRFILNGGYKIGFAIAPLAGQLLADLMLRGNDSIPAEFHPPQC